MPTGDTWVNLVLKRFLSHTRLRSNFLAYLQSITRDLGSRIFPASGLFTFPCSITQTTTDFDLAVSPAGPVEGIDDEGHVLSLSLARQANIPYENDPTFNYWIGLHYTEVPEGMTTNPRTGIAEYDKWREEVGEKSNPSPAGVTDLGAGVIRIKVDSIFQSGVDHSGREVMVWLNDPMSTDENVAIETLTVFYSAGSNYVDTVGSLGQGTVSTNVGDYSVACLGVTIRKNATDPFDSSYVLIGYITGHAVTPTHNADGQRDLSGGGGHTLQRAYDGLAGGGSGRNVTAADNAIQLRQSSSAEKSEDLGNAALRIRKDLNTALPGSGFEAERAIDLLSRFFSGGSVVVRKALADYSSGPDGSSNDQLRIEEDVNVTGVNTLTFTRSGVDLGFDLATYSQIQTFAAGHYVEIFDSPNGNDGVYGVNGLPGGTPNVTCTLRNLDGTIPVLTLESGVGTKARFYIQSVDVDDGAVHGLVLRTPIDFYRDAYGNQSFAQIGWDLFPSFNSRNEWVDFDDDGTTRRVTFAGTETTLTHYVNAINAVLVDSVALEYGAARLYIRSRRAGPLHTLSIVGAQTTAMLNDLFGTTTPSEYLGTDDTDGMHGGSTYGCMHIQAINPQADDPLFKTSGYDVITPLTGEIALYADGHLNADNYIRSSAGDFFAPLGRISVFNNVTSQQGDVEALLGDVTAGDDVIAADSVLAAAGNVVSSLADVRADNGDVYAALDHRYTITKPFKHVIPLSCGEPIFDVGSNMPLWLLVPETTAPNEPLWKHNGTTGALAVGADRSLLFGFRLPHGTRLLGATAILNLYSIGSGVLSMCIEKRQPVWTPGSGAPGANTILGTVTTTGWPTQTDALQLTGLLESINEDDHYYLRIWLDYNDTTTGVDLHALRLECTTLYVRP